MVGGLRQGANVRARASPGHSPGRARHRSRSATSSATSWPAPGGSNPGASPLTVMARAPSSSARTGVMASELETLTISPPGRRRPRARLGPPPRRLPIDDGGPAHRRLHDDVDTPEGGAGLVEEALDVELVGDIG